MGARLTGVLPQTHVQVLELPLGTSVRAARRSLAATGEVAWSEPDRIYRALALPNDPRFGAEWALRNTGQRVAGSVGSRGADIRAPAAWDIATGSPNVTVAVIDTGVSTRHPDLAPNVWTNSADPANGLDDDGDGRVDDTHGWNFVDSNPLVADDNGHGTHVAGLIAARGNDGIGMAGVAWRASLMPLKALDWGGAADASTIVAAMAYATRHGADVVNMSLGGPYSHAIAALIRHNPQTLFVTAAGNDGADEDGEFPEYPCALPYANVVCVAATNQRDELASFSNYGADSVDLAAPGTYALSAQPGMDVRFADDFEAGMADWSVLVPRTWAIATQHASSGRHGLTDAPPPARDDTVETIPFDIDQRQQCWASLNVWASLGANDWFGADEAGDQVDQWPDLRGPALRSGQRVRLALHPYHPGPRTLRLRLHSGDDSRPSATVDDVTIRCVDVLRPPGQTFDYLSGTSMAAPLVSGAAALLLARNGDLSPSELRQALIAGSDPLPALTGKTVSGGRLNVARSLSSVRAGPPPEVTPPPTQPAAPAGDGTAVDPAAGGVAYADLADPRDASPFAAGTAVAIAPDGGIVAGGWTTTDMGSAFALARFTPDGALDPSFGSDGKVVTRVDRFTTGGENYSVDLTALAVQPDEKIIAVGSASEGSGKHDVVVARYTRTGALDRSFGSGGLFYRSVGDWSSRATDVVLQPDGKIVVTVQAAFGPRIALLRLTPAGTLDASFGNGGEVLAPNPPGQTAEADSLALRPDGKIVVSGVGRHMGEPIAFVARYDPQGRLDPAFGDGGFTWGPAPWTGGFAPVPSHPDIAIRDDGRLVLASSAWTRLTYVSVVARYMPDGRPDPAFADGGYLLRRIGTDISGNAALALQPDGKVVTSGVAFNPGIALALSRYLADGRPDPSYGADGTTLATLADGGVLGTEVVLDSSCRAVVVGRAQAKFAVARYLPNGRLDTSFAGNGPAFTPTGQAACTKAPPGTTPAVATGAASHVGTSDAALTGTVDPRGRATTYQFEFWSLQGYPALAPATAASAGAGSGSIPVSTSLGGLTYATTYHYRLIAHNAAGTAYGRERTFKTAARPPAARTGGVPLVARVVARIAGSVTPGGEPTTYHFEYGRTRRYGARSPAFELMVGRVPYAHTVARSLTHLKPATTYHYRVVARAGSRTVYGADRTFTTRAP